jgi:hypothetical protein
MRRSSIIAGVFLAAALASGGVAAAQGSAETGNDDAPVLIDAPWAGAVVIGIAGVFLMAGVIGPAVRIHAPPTHAHDEPPGTSGHHGKTGTVQREP